MLNAYKQKQYESNEKDYKIHVRVYNGGNNNRYAHSIYDCFYVSRKKEKESVQYMGVVSFYPFDKQDRTIGQLIKSKDYEEEQEKINEDCELGYSYGIGNTDVHTSCSFLYV